MSKANLLNKRLRSVNWDDEEKKLFRSILKNHTQIIEDKSLDTNTNKLKAKAWEEILKTFNRLNRRERKLSQLKIQWKAMKVHARKTYYDAYNQETTRIRGGGRPTTPSEDVIEIKTELLIDNNKYDSDGIVLYPDLSPTSPNTENPVLQEDIAVPTKTEEESYMEIKVLDQNKTMESDIESHIQPQQDFLIPLRSQNTAREQIRNTTRDKIRKPIRMVKKFIKKDHQEEYIQNMIKHSHELKEKECNQRMTMARERHALEIKILEEKLKCAQLERKMLEQKFITQ